MIILCILRTIKLKYHILGFKTSRNMNYMKTNIKITIGTNKIINVFFFLILFMVCRVCTKYVNLLINDNKIFDIS